MGKILDLANSRIGAIVDFDGFFGETAMDLIAWVMMNAYGVRVSGLPIDIQNLKIPGFTFHRTNIVTAGDILVEASNANNWGHASIVSHGGNVNDRKIQVIEQSYGSAIKGVSKNTRNTANRDGWGSVIGVLRQDGSDKATERAIAGEGVTPPAGNKDDNGTPLPVLPPANYVDWGDTKKETLNEAINKRTTKPVRKVDNRDVDCHGNMLFYNKELDKWFSLCEVMAVTKDGVLWNKQIERNSLQYFVVGCDEMEESMLEVKEN